MADTSTGIMSPGAHIAGFITGTLIFTLGVVTFYALEITLDPTILLTLAAAGIVTWLLTAVVVGRAD